jgi:adenylosuccinate lyase
MTEWSFSSAIYGGAWATPEMRALFADIPRTRSWLDLLSLLAEVQAEHGLIPAEAAQDIRATCGAIEIDAGFLSECKEGYEATSHSTYGLIAAVARRCSRPGGEWFYFGTTVQDLTDTWLILTLRKARVLLIADLERAIAATEDLCRRHRDTVMAGRTHGQQGLPITFGFKAAGWLAELRRHRRRFDEAGHRMEAGQLCGGVGSLSAMGPGALTVQKHFLGRLGLREPDMSWTASRDVLTEWSQLLVLTTGTADRVGHDIYNLQRDEIGELREREVAEGIGSITMPHKRNPEMAEHLGTLARVVRANAGVLAESLVHDHERDGRSWKVEWHAVPVLTMAAGKAHALLASLLAGLEVCAGRMRANLDAASGYPFSEGVMLALARRVGNQTAYRMVHSLVASARQSGQSFAEALARDTEICAYLSQEERDQLLSAGAQTGQCQALVDRILEMEPSKSKTKAPWAARLDALPHLSLVREPTPLMQAKRLSAAYGGPQLWFKRDDLLPAGFGGNKVRSQDYIAGEALRQGADTLITGAGPLSNHVRASSAVANLAGLRCIAIYWGAPPARAEGNHWLTRLLGAEIRFTGDVDRASVDGGIEAAAAEICARGGRPYCVPRGGACGLGVLAHVLAVRETLDQCAGLGVMPQIVIMAVGGAATLAGWLLGTALFGARWRLEGVAVSRPASEVLARAKNLVAEAAALIDCSADLRGVDFVVHDGFLGGGYGVPSPDGQSAIATTARAEGIFLDPTYTGKAMAAYRTLLSHGRYSRADVVLFLHTGGAPGLFTAAAERMP